MISKGANYIGVEIQETLLESAREYGIEVYAAGEDLNAFIQNESIDLIIAFDVFEHMDLEEVLNSLSLFKELLRPGGLILARVPSGDSPFSGARLQCHHGPLYTYSLLWFSHC